ncbi:MAG: hypothetical protein D3925_08145 [Candidatus Electrothrix sp. AR5]|nr:hypothetical protein [Candidatus Electrothrix sp. AR5]MCI5137152.1 hypothetical protein [Candidatus Electrothrix sp. AR1]
MTVAQLYKQYIKPISITEQLELIALISNKLLVRADVKEKKRSLLELEGLGAEIWEGVDAQQYVDDLRNEWKDRL